MADYILPRRADARHGIIGPNGAGETTTAKLSYVDQSRDHLNDKNTVWQEISDGLDIMKLGD